MKYTVKRNSPASFESWKGQSSEDWQPTFQVLRDPEKAALRVALLEEQGWVCCYCGRSVRETDSHLEHFRPQRFFGDLALEYSNLHASCYRTPEPAATHCGHQKADGFDEALHISPLDPSCEKRFIYAANGEIAARDVEDKRAAYMIQLLGLNSPALRHAREAALSIYDPDFMGTVTSEELERLLASARARDADGRLQNYGHVIAGFAGQYVAQKQNRVT